MSIRQGDPVSTVTGTFEIPLVRISAPTMRVPAAVPDTVNAYLALRAALRAVLARNAAGRGEAGYEADAVRS